VLLNTRISSGAEKLLEERAELTVVAQYQGPDKAEANHPLLRWTRPGACGIPQYALSRSIALLTYSA
jgi:hypothetical protein